MAKKSGRKPRIDRSSPEFEKRAKGIGEARKKGNIKRAKSKFAESLLGSYGFGEENFTSSGLVKGKFGLFAEAMAHERQNKGQHHVPPALEPAKIARDVNNPNISIIINQLAAIVKSANRYGIIGQHQQHDLMQRLQQEERNAKEQRMEGTSQIEALTSIVGTNLIPLNSELGTLIQKIKPYGDVVEEKTKEQEEEKNQNRGFMQRLSEEYGLGDEYETYTNRKKARKARIRTKPGYRPEFDVNTGRTRYRGPNGRWASPANAIADASPSRLQRATGSVRNASAGILNVARRTGSAAGGVATRVGRMASGGSSKRIASLIGGGIRKAGVAASAARGVSSTLIKKIAKPIITKAIGTTVLKSIPIVGTAIGGLFAAKKLLEGDPVGAGLEAASGLAGPFSALAAMTASVARDTYSSAFNVQPEQDPFFGTRMKMITGVIGAMVASMLASRIEKKPTPTKKDIDATIPKNPVAKRTAAEKPTPVPNAPVPAKTKPANTQSSTRSNTTTPARNAGSNAQQTSSRPAPSGGSSSGDAEFESKTPSMITSAPTTGAEIAQKTIEVENAANEIGVVNVGSNQRPLPSMTPTTKSGASGAGDVPDPHYYGMGTTALHIYFSGVVQ